MVDGGRHLVCLQTHCCEALHHPKAGVMASPEAPLQVLCAHLLVQLSADGASVVGLHSQDAGSGLQVVLVGDEASSAL